MALNLVPNAGQNLAITRDPIRNNFNTIDTAFSVNHVSYGLAGQGKHNFVSMPVQAAPPVTAAAEMALFVQDDAFNVPQLYVRQQNNGASIALTPVGGSNLLEHAFSVYLGGTQNNASGDGSGFTIPFDTVVFDNSGDFNVGLSAYVAPVTGTYVFYLAVDTVNNSASAHFQTNCNLVINIGPGNKVWDLYGGGTGGHSSGSGAVLLQLNAGRQVTVQISSSTTSLAKQVAVVGGQSNTYFMGYLLGQ